MDLLLVLFCCCDTILWKKQLQENSSAWFVDSGGWSPARQGRHGSVRERKEAGAGSWLITCPEHTGSREEGQEVESTSATLPARLQQLSQPLQTAPPPGDRSNT